VAVPRRTSRTRYVLLVLVLTAATIMTLAYRGHANAVIDKAKSGARDAFAPVGRVVADAFRPVGNFFRGAVDYGSVKAENARLRKQLGDLRRQHLEQADQRRQLADLLRLQGLPFAEAIPKVTAEVVYLSTSNFQLTVEIDRGSAAGLRAGMPAVAGAGLIGRVVQVARDRSTVLLLTDPSSSVGVRAPNGVVAVATGQGANRVLRVDYLAPGTPLQKGDVFVTSGTEGSIYPPGIPVGDVATAVQRPDSLQEDVTLSPLVDFSQLQYVDVLKWSAGP